MTFPEYALRARSLSASIARGVLHGLAPFGALWRFLRRKVTLLVLFTAVFGMLVGALAVIFPPGVPAAVVGVLGAFLIWAMPDIARVPESLLRKSFFWAVGVNLVVPAFYAVQIQGLPWISVRRIFLAVVIFALAIVLGGSAPPRKRIAEMFRSNRPLAVCFLGFPVIAVLSVFTSTSPANSLSVLLDMALTWYIPFLACVSVVRSREDIILVFRIMGYCSLFVAAVGTAEFILERRFVIDLLPKWIANALLYSNPQMAEALAHSPYRDGIYRASSIYLVSLSFGEFAAMMAPIGVFFAFHAERYIDRALGVAVIFASIVSLIVSGSRGGSIGMLAALFMLTAIGVIRTARLNPRSLAGAIAGVFAASGVSALVAAIFLWKRLHNIVLGGGQASSSTDSRLEQWALAKPLLASNPLTGHGIGLGAETLGYAPFGFLSIDSYVISLLVETGVPGLAFYMGAIFFAVWSCVRIYIRKLDRLGTLAGPLAASLLAYGLYRITLSQRDNQTLYYLLLGLAFVYLDLVRREGEREAVGAPTAPSLDAAPTLNDRSATPLRQASRA